MRGSLVFICETRLSGTEESRHPHRDSFMRLIGSFAIEIEDACVMGAYRVGNDILVDFVPEYLLVGLIDLDDLFNVAVNLVREKTPNKLCRHN